MGAMVVVTDQGTEVVGNPTNPTTTTTSPSNGTADVATLREDLPATRQAEETTTATPTALTQTARVLPVNSNNGILLVQRLTTVRNGKKLTKSNLTSFLKNLCCSNVTKSLLAGRPRNHSLPPRL